MATSTKTRWALILSFAVLLVAGIAGATFASADGAAEAADNTGSGSAGSIRGFPGGSTIVPPSPVPQPAEPRPGMADVYARPFDEATVADDDVTVTVDFMSGIEPCYVLDHVDVAYGAHAVTITLFEGHDPAAGQVVCIEIGVFKSVTITLDQPLAGRDIIDGAAS